VTHEEHYAEAERLRKLAVDAYMNPEGGYDDTEPPSIEELKIREAVRKEAQADAALYLAEAQVHATLALYLAAKAALTERIAEHRHTEEETRADG